MSNLASSIGLPLLRVSRAARYWASRSIRSANYHVKFKKGVITERLYVKRFTSHLVDKPSTVWSIHCAPFRAKFKCTSCSCHGFIDICLKSTDLFNIKEKQNQSSRQQIKYNSTFIDNWYKCYLISFWHMAQLFTSRWIDNSKRFTTDRVDKLAINK